MLFHDRYFLNMVQSSKQNSRLPESYDSGSEAIFGAFLFVLRNGTVLQHKAKRPSEGKKRPMVRQHRRGNGLLCSCAQKGYVMLVVPTMCAQ